ncbi:hypothetical protein LY76DRAFT_589574 [Colletotrichum caudatum]|nr:hypothetical protein LY76DRAFT_589574 [Colletotrichum caudatum]
MKRVQCDVQVLYEYLALAVAFFDCFSWAAFLQISRVDASGTLGVSSTNTRPGMPTRQPRA